MALWNDNKRSLFHVWSHIWWKMCTFGVYYSLVKSVKPFIMPWKLTSSPCCTSQNKSKCNYVNVTTRLRKNGIELDARDEMHWQCAKKAVHSKWAIEHHMRSCKLFEVKRKLEQTWRSCINATRSWQKEKVCVDAAFRNEWIYHYFSQAELQNAYLTTSLLVAFVSNECVAI